MASIYQRRHTWWLQFYHPLSGVLTRVSLETHDPARAELLRKKVEVEVMRLDPRFQAAEIPVAVLEALGGSQIIAAPAANPSDPPVNAFAAPSACPYPSPKPATRVALDDALKAYMTFIRMENASRHVENKLSMVRRFLGTERTEPFVVSDALDCLYGMRPALLLPAERDYTHFTCSIPRMIR